tara:strand:+ start:3415 stop:5565 length:2151 start_codon:yes stop_codon:yes gene_type:complete
MKQLNVTELDFDQIATNLKAFFKRADSPFKDWDFSGSGLSLLIDVLAYNTHYNAMLAHIAVNESFLGSAQLRKNVVARAKTLGYLPYSNSAASSIVWLEGTGISSLTDIPSGTNFTSTIGGVSYNFATFGSTTKDFSVAANRYLTIYQGSRKTVQFQFDDKVLNPRFELPDADVDIKSELMTITTKAVGSSAVTSYTRFTELADIEATTPVYFISENPNGLYQIEFGDGTLGASPTNRDIITVTYLVTDGKGGNGATTFDLSSTLTDTTGSSLDISVLNTVDPAGTTTEQDAQRADRATPTLTSGIPTISTGGTNRESIEQIRFNAPLNFQAQDRAVTANDYKALILSNSGAKYVSVWGGEDEPEYDPKIHKGNVYVCAKTDETPGYLSESDKDALGTILESKGVLTIQHVFVNHNIVSLYFDIFVKYDPSLSASSTNTLASDIRTTIQNFANDNLQDFFSVFRHSKFLKTIDDSNQSFMHSVARLKGYFTHDYNTDNLQNYNAPIGGGKTQNMTAYVIDLGMPLDRIFEIKSSTFPIATATGYNPSCFIRSYNDGSNSRYRFLYVVTSGNDEIIPGQGSKTLRGQKTTQFRDLNGGFLLGMQQFPVGRVDYDTGTVVLFNREDTVYNGVLISLFGRTGDSFTVNNETFTTDFPTDPFEFRFKPASDNVVARRRSIIDIDVTKSTITVEKDAIKYLGSKGASAFDTIERIDPDFDL